MQPEAPPPKLAIHQASSLARALRRRLTSLPGPSTAMASRPVVTLREMTERLLEAMTGARRFEFDTFRRQCQDRQEVLVAFLSVLALVRRRVVDAEQHDLFGTITLSRPVGTGTVTGDTADGHAPPAGSVAVAATNKAGQ